MLEDPADAIVSRPSTLHAVKEHAVTGLCVKLKALFTTAWEVILTHFKARVCEVSREMISCRITCAHRAVILRAYKDFAIELVTAVFVGIIHRWFLRRGNLLLEEACEVGSEFGFLGVFVVGLLLLE